MRWLVASLRLAFFAALVSGGCSERERVPPVLVSVDPADETCDEDRDCAGIEANCECDCVSAVNRAALARYREKWAAICPDVRCEDTCAAAYSVSKVGCVVVSGRDAEGFPKCDEHKCHLSSDP
jgi:hypothetical protein